jgi:hypothetical protein
VLTRFPGAKVIGVTQTAPDASDADETPPPEEEE